MSYNDPRSDVCNVPLALKYSPDYFQCPCGRCCFPRCLEILIEKFSSRVRFLYLSDFQLNVYSVNKGVPDLLLERFFIQSVHVEPSSLQIDNTLKKRFEIRVYREWPHDGFTIYCRAKDDLAIREWQRALMIFQQREMKQINEIIKLYLELE